MRIGIDMRMAGTGEGIGRYIEELVNHLSEIDQQNQYFLLVNNNPRSQFSNPNFQFVKIESAYYSLAEQTKFISELLRLKLNIVHFASFNVPIFYPRKYIVTIHDIIHHIYPGKKKSRFFHRLAYRAVIASAIWRAAKIIAVSESTKQEIIKTFRADPKRIATIYEGARQTFAEKLNKSAVLRAREKYGIGARYLLFTGVWRQYKNLPRLARVFDILRDEYGHDLELVLSGKIDPFYPEIERAVMSSRNWRHIKALGFVPDEDLAALYQGCALFVLPSLMEGFGLIGIEAQKAGAAVAASDIPVLREVLGEGAVYFNPRDERQMAQVINLALRDDNLKSRLLANAAENAARFDWKKTAMQTLQIYREAAK